MYSDTIKYGDRLYSFGSDSIHILKMIENEPGLGERIHPLFDFTKAEVIWAVRNEMAILVEDYLARRSRMLFLNANAAMESAALVASIMAKELGREDCWQKDQVAEFHEIASAYLPKV